MSKPIILRIPSRLNNNKFKKVDDWGKKIKVLARKLKRF